MQKKYFTSRLVLRPVNLHDAAFILELLNTKGWIQFIGDRKVNNIEDSRNYIQKIMNNPHTLYWVARLEREHASVGIISFIKRSYLEHWDIGFAFLPAFFGNGYAYESAEKILQEMLKNPQHSTILATTKVDNQSSIHLIEKIGFHFKKEMENETERLLLYSITAS
jgi:[ribosomal protein S5]-alanine N-acetyltransferase